MRHLRNQIGIPKTSQEVETIFIRSLALTYPELFYQVYDFEITENKSISDEFEETREKLRKEGVAPDDLEDRWVFHTNKDLKVAKSILRTNLRPSNCAFCQKGQHCGDPGWFGDHTKGVYLSKHADYTFFYQAQRKVKAGDSGYVIAFKMFTGKRKKLDDLSVKGQPMKGFHCHESINFLEYFLYDPKQLLPCYIIYWRAKENQRGGIVHDGLHHVGGLKN